MTLDKLVTAPERLQTWLDNPEGKRLPFSCTLVVLKADTNIGEVIEWTTQSLKAGAGVKLIISDTFRLPTPRPNFKVELVLDSEHLDWDLVAVEDREANVISCVARFDGIAPSDSIESIAESWRTLYDNPWDDLVVDLSSLRPKDSVNSDGLLASGPMTFGLVYEAIALYRRTPTIHTLLRLFGVLNEVILRGGYKKGIITSAIEDTSIYYQEYLSVPLVSLRGSHKKGVILSKPPDNVGQLCDLVNYESLFLQKAQPSSLYANVCMGIFLEDRGTCLINRVNLGRLENLADIPGAFVQATIQALYAHLAWRQQQPERAKQWAALDQDNQIAMDVMGVANLLRRLGLTYLELIEALEGRKTAASSLVMHLQDGYLASVKAADAWSALHGLPKMVRLHTIEPAQAHCYRTTDLDGYTTARGIWPPFSQIVNRYSQSAAEPVLTYNHGKVADITPHDHFRLCAGWHKLMADYGRVHAVSFDTWEPFSEPVFQKWYASSLLTLYYNMSGDYATRGYARKRFAAPSLCSSCTD